MFSRPIYSQIVVLFSVTKSQSPSFVASVLLNTSHTFPANRHFHNFEGPRVAGEGWRDWEAASGDGGALLGLGF